MDHNPNQVSALPAASEEPDTPHLSAYVYVARGWRVLPMHGVHEVDGEVRCTCDEAAACSSPGTHLIDGISLVDATTDANKVNEWWREYPHANVAVLSGEESGLAVITVDDDLFGPQVQPIVDALLGAGPPIIRRNSGSSSVLLFRSPKDGEAGTDAARGLDYMGGHGLVLAPPSRLGVGRVEWEGGAAGRLTDLPLTYRQLAKMVTEIGAPAVVKPAPPRFGAPSRSVTPAFSVEPVLIAMSSIESKPISWLLPGRIPLNELTMLGGHPSAGKSVLAAEVIALVTRGAPAPVTGEPIPAGSAIIMSREEDPARAIHPRLVAAGADMAKVFVLNDVREPHGERGVRLPLDVGVLDRVCQQHDVRLLVIDPITDFLHRVDANSEQAVRQALLPLVQLARRLEIAIVFVRHLTKRDHTNLLHHGMGSVAFGAVARAGLLVERAGDHRVLRTTKSSCCPEGVAPLAFRIVEAPVQSGGTVGRVEWIGNADELTPPAPPTALERAKAFLMEQLASGPVLASELLTRAEAARLGERNLREAKKALGIESKGKPSAWQPPSQDCNAAAPYGECSVAALDDDVDEES